jgi:glutaredoxin
MPDVEIFYSDMCSSCHDAMDYFRGRGIPYRAYPIQWTSSGMVDSEASRDLRSRCGDVDFVPQIFINGRHIGGWTALSELIETNKLNALLNPIPL